VLWHFATLYICFASLSAVNNSSIFLSVISPDSVVCHGLAVGQITSHYFLIQRPMSWSKAREFCQRHYVDLAVLNMEDQYFTLLNATLAKKASFWLGLQWQSIFSGWTWVNGEELSYKQWYRRNYEGQCASLEAMLEKDKKLLARYCDEPHMFVCQGQ
uniref:C-type lectin domain-containing protein n=1 Tax=Lates calcarifer TaxID=8187 RepID=A0A4W6BR21_LATCA